MKILHIDSAITLEQSLSKKITKEVVNSILNQEPTASVTYLDLSEEAPEHLTLDKLDPLNPWLKAVKEADLLVIGAPMYNLSIPSQLKSWLDRIMIAGSSFKYTEKGAEGLLGPRKAIIVSTRGGVYKNDFQENLMVSALQFIGIESTVIRAEGVAFSEEHRNEALKNALLNLNQLCEKQAA